MKKKEFNKFLELIKSCSNAQVINESKLDSEGGETFLEKNARESNEIATSNLQAAIREAERDRELKEVSIRLTKVIKNLERHEKRLEKIETKLLSFQDKMLKQKEWFHDVDNNIKALDKKAKKQNKDICLIKNIFKACNGNSGKFKSIAKEMIKFYSKKAKEMSSEYISSQKDIFSIEDNGGYIYESKRNCRK